MSPYALIARARADIDRLKTVLESYGYYESKITIQIDGMALTDPGLADHLNALPKKQDAHVQIAFKLGPLYHLRNIRIDGELPPSVAQAFTLKTGEPGGGRHVLAAGARLLAALEEQGYAFAKVDPPVAYEDKTQPLARRDLSRRGGSARQHRRDSFHGPEASAREPVAPPPAAAYRGAVSCERGGARAGGPAEPLSRRIRRGERQGRHCGG